MYHSEWKNVKVVGTFRCCSFFELLMMTCSLIYSHNISWFRLCDWSYFSVKGNYASSTRRALACFFLSNNKPFRRTVCRTAEAIKTSAITITRATKFIAVLRLLHFDTKIHTCALNNFFVGKDMLQSRFERNFLESGNLICLG